MTKTVTVQGTQVVVSDTTEVNGVSPFMRTVISATTAAAAQAALGLVWPLAVSLGGVGIDMSATGGTGRALFQDTIGGVVTVRALVANDIPSLNTSKLTAGQLALARGGTGADLSATGGTGQFLKQSTLGGVVTVGGIDTGDIGTGILGVARGGTGLGTYAVGSILYASAAAVLSPITPNATTTLKFLANAGDGVTPGPPLYVPLSKNDIPGTLNATTFGDGAAAISIILDGIAGTERALEYRSHSARRWLAMAGNAAESGSNAGSSYIIRAYADDGTTIIDSPLTITRAASGAITFARPLTLFDGGTVTIGATVGTKIGASTSEKLGFYGVTPIVQPAGTTDLRTALINLGLYASGGASPLNLNGGALTAAAGSFSGQITSTVATGSSPLVVASTTVVANLNAALLNGATFAAPGTIGGTTPGAATFTGVTNSALTSGRVMFSAAAGLQTDGAGLTYSANVLTVGDGTSSAQFLVNGAAAQARQLSFKTNGVSRWNLIGANSTAETGSNAGSDFTLRALDDAGSTIDSPINITRASGGAVVFTRPLQPGSGSAGAPSYAFSTDATTGLFRVSAGTISHVAAGVEYLRASAAQFTYSKNTSVLLGTAPISNVANFTIHGADGVASQIALCAYGASAGLVTRRTEGTAALPTQIVANSVLRNDQVVGYEATTPGFSGNRNVYLILGSEAWTSTAQGYFHRWDASNTGTTSALEKMRLTQGNLLIGTTTDGMTANGSLAIAQDLAHRGTKAGFYNRSPVTQPAVPTYAAITTVATAGASYTATEQGMLGTLKADVIALRAMIVALTNRLDQTATSFGLLSGTAT